jgi:hypothetical protein
VEREAGRGLLRRVAQFVEELPGRVPLYLAGIGLGVGALVGEVTTDAGTTVSYAGFVAPALLVTAVMNGAVIDTTFAVFYRLRFARGELGWGLVRALLYAGSFLVLRGAADLAGHPGGPDGAAAGVPVLGDVLPGVDLSRACWSPSAASPASSAPDRPRTAPRAGRGGQGGASASEDTRRPGGRGGGTSNVCSL